MNKTTITKILQVLSYIITAALGALGGATV